MQSRRRDRRRYLMGELLIQESPSIEPVRAVIMNINRGGVGVYAALPLKKKAPVVVRVAYREGARMKSSEEIPGVVRWCQSVGTSYGAGISFSQRVTRKNFPLLNKCLERARLNG